MNLEPHLRARQLEEVGALHDAGDTIYLLAPDAKGFWPAFTRSPEYADGAPDPLDRYSKRLIGSLAEVLGGRAVFPSDGPPYPPFIAWALESGHAWASPVGFLVGDRQGLWLSFRGALRVSGERDLPGRGGNPCESCDGQPCRKACPVGAVSGGSYDVQTCRDWLDEGGDCMQTGCAVRRACPVSRRYGRLQAQSAFHMRAFHPK